MKIIKDFLNVIKHYYCKDILIPKRYDLIEKRYFQYTFLSIKDTINELLHSNKSLSRFGNGEFEGILHANNNDLEQNSPQLHKKLLKVLNSNDNNLMVSVPDGFILDKNLVSNAKFFWKIFMITHGEQVLSLLRKNKIYYNACVTRPYIDYNNRKLAKDTFTKWKKFWNNKNILIIEGSKSRLGVGNDLFNNVKDIKRIECPYKDAFESYNKILDKSLSFLRNNNTYIALIALGQTATVLSYDLCKAGFRGIDIGNIDLEYEWYLIGAKEKINIPSRYVNEAQDGHYASPIHDENYYNEIICKIV